MNGRLAEEETFFLHHYHCCSCYCLRVFHAKHHFCENCHNKFLRSKCCCHSLVARKLIPLYSHRYYLKPMMSQVCELWKCLDRSPLGPSVGSRGSAIKSVVAWDEIISVLCVFKCFLSCRHCSHRLKITRLPFVTGENKLHSQVGFPTNECAIITVRLMKTLVYPRTLVYQWSAFSVVPRPYFSIEDGHFSQKREKLWRLQNRLDWDEFQAYDNRMLDRQDRSRDIEGGSILFEANLT